MRTIGRTIVASIDRRAAVVVLGSPQSGTALNVRFGSKAEVRTFYFDVRFTPESGHQLSALGVH